MPVIDINLPLLEDLLSVIDRQLDRVDKEAQEYPDPEDFEICDQWEGAAGLGFVACQNYLAATRRYPSGKGTKTLKEWKKEKERQLAVGPKHAPSDQFIAVIVDAAANVAKHRDEDVFKSTRKVIRKLKLDPESPCLISNILAEVAAPRVADRPRFAALIPLLQQWGEKILKEDRPLAGNPARAGLLTRIVAPAFAPIRSLFTSARVLAKSSP